MEIILLYIQNDNEKAADITLNYWRVNKRDS